MNPGEHSVWDSNNGLLQSFRQSMILSQSLLMVLAALLRDAPLLDLPICGIGLLQLWYVWNPVIRSRTLVSDFHKFNALYGFSRRVNPQGGPRREGEPELSEEVYVSRPAVRRRANALLAEQTGITKLRSNLRPTRKKLDRVLPASYTLIWVILLLALVR